jgi:hypothetical protein
VCHDDERGSGAGMRSVQISVAVIA